jgi:hypothetical protein
LAAVLALTSFVLVASAPAAEEITAVRYKIAKEIKVPPAKVWMHLTSGKSLVAWCPVWKKDANQSATLGKVGDSVDFTDEYGNGAFIAKEIRVAHEPADGSYICQARIMVEPTAAGTRVTLIEQYTDESKPEDRKATAAKSQTEMESALSALAKLCES